MSQGAISLKCFISILVFMMSNIPHNSVVSKINHSRFRILQGIAFPSRVRAQVTNFLAWIKIPNQENY